MNKVLNEEQRREIIDSAFTKYLDFVGESQLHQIARMVLLHLKSPSDKDTDLIIPFAGASTQVNRELTAQSFARSYQVAIKEVGDALGYPDYSEEQLVRNAMLERALEIYKEHITENKATFTELIKNKEVAFERQKKGWLSGGSISYLIRGKENYLPLFVEGLLVPDIKNKGKIEHTRNRDSGLWTIKISDLSGDDFTTFTELAASDYNMQITNQRNCA